MAPGHPAVLWVTRGDPVLEPGVRAVGVVTAEARADVGEPDDPLWRDLAAQQQVRPYVEVRLAALDRPVTAAEVRAAVAATARIGYGHCERMTWHEDRWMIAPGVPPAKAPPTWPGSALALQAGWRTWQTGSGRDAWVTC